MMALPAVLGCVFGMGVLIHVHRMHRHLCARLGRVPQRFPYPTFSAFALILIAIVVLAA
jgi:hypothetical protein